MKAIQFECRRKLFTVSEIQLTVIRSKLFFVKELLIEKLFMSFQIFQILLLLVKFRLFCWLFVWKLASFGMYAICVKIMLRFVIF